MFLLYSDRKIRVLSRLGFPRSSMSGTSIFVWNKQTSLWLINLSTRQSAHLLLCGRHNTILHLFYQPVQPVQPQFRARRLTAKALFDDLVIYPYSLTRLGSTRWTGFQTHSQVWRAEGLNPDPRIPRQSRYRNFGWFYGTIPIKISSVTSSSNHWQLILKKKFRFPCKWL